METTERRFDFLKPMNFVKTFEIPKIRIFDDEQIPPISQVAFVNAGSFILPWRLDCYVNLHWRVKNDVFVFARRRFTDRRVKEQYLADVQCKQIIDLFLLELTRKTEPCQFHDDLSRIDDLTKLPPETIPYVAQAKLWQLKIAEIKTEGLLAASSARIDDDEYYIVEVRTDWFAPDHSCYYPGTIISYKPEILEDYVYWTDNDCKIRFTLPHHFSTPTIAKRFGYLEIYKEVIRKREEEAKQLADNSRSKQIILQEERSRYDGFVLEMMSPLPPEE